MLIEIEKIFLFFFFSRKAFRIFVDWEKKTKGLGPTEEKDN